MERRRKQENARRKMPKLVLKVRRWLLTKSDGVPSSKLIERFLPMCLKHGFTKAMFRDALRKAGRCSDGLWTASVPSIDAVNSDVPCVRRLRHGPVARARLPQ